MFVKTNFELVSDMNTAFGNPKGDATKINHDKIRSQCNNILHEYAELLKALGADAESIQALRFVNSKVTFDADHFELDAVRDALCDVNVFSLGAFHLMGIDANRDMQAVHRGIMTRFIKDEADKQATIDLHAAQGVTEVYFEGDYPTMIMKSAKAQPDAPKGKFLKSASFSEPVFYPVEFKGDKEFMFTPEGNLTAIKPIGEAIQSPEGVNWLIEFISDAAEVNISESKRADLKEIIEKLPEGATLAMLINDIWEYEAKQLLLYPDHLDSREIVSKALLLISSNDQV